MVLALIILPVIHVSATILMHTMYPPQLTIVPDERLTDGLLHLNNGDGNDESNRKH
jgi:hypothetical protein